MDRGTYGIHDGHDHGHFGICGRVIRDPESVTAQHDDADGSKGVDGAVQGGEGDHQSRHPYDEHQDGRGGEHQAVDEDRTFGPDLVSQSAEEQLAACIGYQGGGEHAGTYGSGKAIRGGNAGHMLRERGDDPDEDCVEERHTHQSAVDALRSFGTGGDRFSGIVGCIAHQFHVHIFRTESDGEKDRREEHQQDDDAVHDIGSAPSGFFDHGGKHRGEDRSGDTAETHGDTGDHAGVGVIPVGDDHRHRHDTYETGRESADGIEQVQRDQGSADGQERCAAREDHRRYDRHLPEVGRTYMLRSDDTAEREDDVADGERHADAAAADAQFF